MLPLVPSNHTRPRGRKQTRRNALHKLRPNSGFSGSATWRAHNRGCLRGGCFLQSISATSRHPRSWTSPAATNGAASIYQLKILAQPGIYPDQLHILDLAIYTDVFSSMFLLYTDKKDLFAGAGRDDRLRKIWEQYAAWCAENGNLP